MTPHYEPGGHEGFMGRDIGQSCEKRKTISRRDASRHSRYPKQGPGPKMAKVITEVVCLFRNRKGRKTVAVFSGRSASNPTGCRALKQGHEAGNGESHYGRGVSSWQKRSVKGLAIRCCVSDCVWSGAVGHFAAVVTPANLAETGALCRVAGWQWGVRGIDDGAQKNGTTKDRPVSGFDDRTDVGVSRPFRPRSPLRR